MPRPLCSNAPHWAARWPGRDRVRRRAGTRAVVLPGAGPAGRQGRGQQPQPGGGRGRARAGDHVADEITAAGGEAVAEYSDAADPGAGHAMVAAALRRWGRLDICVANAAIGVGGMFHKQPAEQFDEVLAVNLQGSTRLARAAMAVMRPASYGRIILVASTGGLHSYVGLSAYAASKGGLLAFVRSLAAEGAGKGVLANLLLQYALTQMTDNGMPPAARKHMEPDAVAPVLTAPASEGCRLNGQYIASVSSGCRPDPVIGAAGAGAADSPW